MVAAPAQCKPAPRGVWDLALAALGLNLWTCLVLVPVLNLGERTTLPAQWSAAVPLLLLAVGIWRRNAPLLLGFFPISLLLPVVAHKALASSDIYTGTIFLLVASAVVTYVVAAPWTIARTRRPPRPAKIRPVEDTVSSRPKWRRRRRVYLYIAALTTAFPIVLLYAAYFRPGAFQEFARFYPERADAAAVLSGMLALALWITLFFIFFARPMVAHIRGDPQLRINLRRFLSNAKRQRVGPVFFVTVVAAATAMVLLLARTL